MASQLFLHQLRSFGAERIKSIGTGIQIFYRSLIDFVYPPFCLLCDRHLEAAERLVCNACWSGLPALQKPLKEFSESRGFLFTRALSIWEYSDRVQDLIHHLKYFRRPVLGMKMGEALAQLLADYEEFAGADFLIPVPLHARKLRERGYNQSLVLAQTVAQKSGIVLFNQALKRIRYTRPQAQLNADDRAKNVLNAFCLQKNSSLADKTVILVDDVLTTGNTLNECARVCKSSGARQVYALTVARV